MGVRWGKKKETFSEKSQESKTNGHGEGSGSKKKKVWEQIWKDKKKPQNSTQRIDHSSVAIMCTKCLYSGEIHSNIT